MRRYLNDIGCKVIIEEPVYFDHDYLAEFAAFYCKSTRGYSNSCRRLHFFANPDLTRSEFERAAAEQDESDKRLESAYLGFAVIRPFEPPLLGRTVLAWYPPDPSVEGHRVTTPSRKYTVHLAGIRLTVRGLAWQPQDRAVGACATVALWSMLHSSAFDDHHAIPTTAAITEAAHKNASLGSRVYPSSGLTTYQLFEAIKAQQLAPNVMEGDKKVSDGIQGFTPERFLATSAAFIRSGYPVLVWGMQIDREPQRDRGMHAVCITGFREARVQHLGAPAGWVGFEDSNVEILYVHDDGLGPGVRCRVTRGDSGEVRLTPAAPPPRNGSNLYPDPSLDYPHFQPMSMVVAVHDGLVITSDGLHKMGLEIAYEVSDTLGLVAASESQRPVVSLQTRFISLREYLTKELRDRLGRGELLGRVRLGLAEAAMPMSLHLGLVRLSVDGVMLMDILFDTTDNEEYLRAFAHLRYHEICASIVPPVQLSLGRHLGASIDAFTRGGAPQFRGGPPEVDRPDRPT